MSLSKFPRMNSDNGIPWKRFLPGILTGQRIRSRKWCWDIMSPLESRFCCLKVFVTQSTWCRKGSEWGKVCRPLMNQKFLKTNSIVFLFPETLTYLQECIAKKNSPINSSHKALSAGEIDISWTFLRIEAVMAIWEDTGVSREEYPLSWHCKMNANFPSPSSLRAGWSVNL